MSKHCCWPDMDFLMKNIASRINLWCAYMRIFLSVNATVLMENVMLTGDHNFKKDSHDIDTNDDRW